MVSAERAERLLLAWSNLRDDPKACLALLINHQDVFQDVLPIKSTSLFSLRRVLRDAWVASDARHRDWYLFQLRLYFQHLINSRKAGVDVDEVSEKAMTGDKDAAQQLLELTKLGDTPTAIEAVLFYLQTRLGSRLRYCPNPDCAAPYFIKSPSNPKQTACSPECADWVRKESKRRWWAENRGAGAGDLYRKGK